MRVLYDGWSLVRNPISPSALHLLAILENLTNEIDPVVAFPEPAAEWIGDIPVEIRATPNTASGRLRWEQVVIPMLGRKLKVQLLHLTTSTAPLVSGLRTLFSPSEFGAGMDSFLDVTQSPMESASFFPRLRRSSAQGGMAQVKEILWPTDLPRSAAHASLVSLPPIVPIDFIPHTDRQIPNPGEKVDLIDDRVAQLALPESFVLYHGPGDRQYLKQLLQAWNWAADAIGASTPLLVIGLEGTAQYIFSDLVEELKLGDNLRLLQDVKPDLLPILYRNCTAVFHPAPASAWCGPVRLALASGKPLVAGENSFTEAITGPAAYLADGKDARALGAALITIIVEEQVAESLSAAAITRTASWISTGFGEQLHLRYQAVLLESG